MRNTGRISESTDAPLDLLLRTCRNFLERGSAGQPCAPLSNAIPDTRLYERHRIVPLLATLVDGNADSGPCAPLLHRAGGIALRNEQLLTETVRVSRLLQERAIPHLCFKGPVLAMQLHGSPALRQSDDIDLLLPPEAIQSAAEALLSAGYRHTHALPAGAAAAFLASGWDVGLTLPSGGFEVELGHSVLPPYAGAPDYDPEMFTRAVSLAVGMAQIPAPADVDLYRLLSLHGFMHAWSRLAWLVDMAVLRNRVPPNERPPLPCTVTETLEVLVTMLTGGPSLATARRCVAEHLAARIVQGWTAPDPYRLSWSDQLYVHDRPVARIRMLARIFFQPTYGDWARINLPPGLHGAYALLRPFRLALRRQRASSADRASPTLPARNQAR